MEKVKEIKIENVPLGTSSVEIEDLLKTMGKINKVTVKDTKATVEFNTEEEAKKTVDILDGYIWKGNSLKLKLKNGVFDIEHESILMNLLHNNNISCDPILFNNNKLKESNVSKEEDNCKQLFVGNIPFHCQSKDLKELFKECGRIIKVDIVLNFEGRSRGFGTVLFSSHQDAKKAIEKFDGYEFHNRTLRVHFDKFAATHQRLREQEAETYGQRQLQDPISVQLLKETYQSQYYTPPPSYIPYPYSTPYSTTTPYSTVTSPYTGSYSYTTSTTTAPYPISTTPYSTYSNSIYPTTTSYPISTSYPNHPNSIYSSSYNNSNSYQDNSTLFPQQNFYQPWMDQQKDNKEFSWTE